jgi:hypothetical protein
MYNTGTMGKDYILKPYLQTAIITFYVSVLKDNSQEALNLLVTEERYWAPFYMTLSAELPTHRRPCGWTGQLTLRVSLSARTPGVSTLRYCGLSTRQIKIHFRRRYKTLGYGFHFQHRNPRTFPIETLSMIVDAPWYVPNTAIRRDLQTPTVKEEIRRYSSQYSARLSAHTNSLVVNVIELPDNRRLRNNQPNDLPTRFLV